MDGFSDDDWMGSTGNGWSRYDTGWNFSNTYPRGLRENRLYGYE